MKTCTSFCICIIAIASFSSLMASCSKPNTTDESTTTAPLESTRGTDDERPTTTPQFQCYLMGEGITELEGQPWAGDLGIPFSYQNSIHFITGDVFCENPDATESQAYAVTTQQDPTQLSMTISDWQPFGQTGNVPREIQNPIGGISLPPTGALELGDNIYIFMMDITHWSRETDEPGRARAVMLKSTDGGASYQYNRAWAEVDAYSYDNKFTNISPVLGMLGANRVIFMFGSGPYRGYDGTWNMTPNVYLAYCEDDPTALESTLPDHNYNYFCGVQQGIPQWSHSEVDAVPIYSLDWLPLNLTAGELSVQWCPYLNSWLMLSFDFHFNQGHLTSILNFYKSPNPWGLWMISEEIMNCDDELSWYPDPWWGHPAYGGYLLTDFMIGSDVYWVLSLWKPYAEVIIGGTSEDLHARSIVLVKNDLSTLTWGIW